MRRFALGALLYTPERFGGMIVGDFVDAIAGYHEAEGERIKAVAELIRTSTWWLYNTQMTEEGIKQSPEDLWPFAWDKKTEVFVMPEEQRREIEDVHERYLNGES